jgi:hypothetical protein
MFMASADSKLNNCITTLITLLFYDSDTRVHEVYASLDSCCGRLSCSNHLCDGLLHDEAANACIVS